MLEQIISIIADYQGISPESIHPANHLANDIGLNSYDVIMLTCQFEDVFGISISDKDISEIQTVDDIVNYIKSKV